MNDLYHLSTFEGFSEETVNTMSDPRHEIMGGVVNCKLVIGVGEIRTYPLSKSPWRHFGISFTGRIAIRANPGLYWGLSTYLELAEASRQSSSPQKCLNAETRLLDSRPNGNSQVTIRTKKISRADQLLDRFEEDVGYIKLVTKIIEIKGYLEK